MNMMILSGLAAAVILTWSIHCILSDYDDGIIGKVFYIGAALSSLGEVITCTSDKPQIVDPALLMIISIAGVILRHWWVREGWPRLQRHLLAAEILSKSRKLK